MKYEDCSEILIETVGDEETLLTFEDDGLITFVKGKAKENIFQKARITSKGEDLLSDLETPEILEEDLKLFDWGSSYYKKLGKKVGNAKKCKMYIALFRVNSGIARNKLVKLLQVFLRDEVSQEYSFVLEYVFFKPSNIYSTRFDIHQSRLYQFYLGNKELFDQEFEKPQYQK